MRVFLAGVDTVRWVQIVAQARAAQPTRPVHCLTSILQHKTVQKFETILAALRTQLPGCCVLLDSGAHTFHARQRRGETVNRVEVRRYLDRYIDILQKSRYRPDLIVELDLQPELGVELVYRWREDVWFPLAREIGCQVAYVWNPLEKVAGIRWLVARPEVTFIALSMAKEALAAGQAQAHLHLLQEARAAGKRTHVFMATTPALMLQLPCWSVDSISWKSPELFGHFIVRRRAGDYASASISRAKPINHQAARSLVEQGLAADVLTGRQAAHKWQPHNAMAVNIAQYWRMEQEATALWAARGVTWDD